MYTTRLARRAIDPTEVLRPNRLKSKLQPRQRPPSASLMTQLLHRADDAVHQKADEACDVHEQYSPPHRPVLAASLGAHSTSLFVYSRNEANMKELLITIISLCLEHVRGYIYFLPQKRPAPYKRLLWSCGCPWAVVNIYIESGASTASPVLHLALRRRDNTTDIRRPTRTYQRGCYALSAQ
ncbi:hypothetical protein EVAR_62829_1 [Eumeta japonica]|uniref:Uncharacterized protein n=1 Tax=Eumeta variegata TaxID=151549 RepID=A0A4C2A5V1_EUMVA|nr:hypothetical protein EVAR_62829_1 [Eumeta japonica]